MIKKAIIIFLLTIITINPFDVFAAWQGPQEVLSGTWGTGTGQFYLFKGDSGDYYPKDISIDKNGLIIIPDEENNRIVIYKPDGKLMNTLLKPAALPDIDSDSWPSNFVLYPGGNSFAIDCEYKKMPLVAQGL